VHRLAADNRYRPIIASLPIIGIGRLTVGIGRFGIGQLFGADNRPADNQPKHYRCTSNSDVDDMLY